MSRKSHLKSGAIVSVLFACSFPSSTVAQTATLPTSGCPMAHCDNEMTDNVNIALPSTVGGVSLIKHDSSTSGSLIGLGCVSNGPGNMAACSLHNGTGPNLVVYDGDGNRKWASNLFDSYAYTSAPIITASGDVIAADIATVARFDSAGNVIWKQSTPGGMPISPVIVNGSNGSMIFIATLGGPISLYSFVDGSLLGTLTIRDPDGSGPYDTVNTPSVNGNAVYVALQKENDANHTGKLAKVVVNPGANPVLSVAWTYTFGGPSGASPLYSNTTNSIYFDASSQNPGGSGPPLLIGLVDGGSAPVFKWSAAMPARIEASPALDPRGGLWAFATGKQYLWRFNEADGSVLQQVDVNALIAATGATYGPSSATTITPNPMMLVGVNTIQGTSGPTYVAGIDLTKTAGGLLWKYKLANYTVGDVANGQFPIVLDGSGIARIVFTTYHSGAYFLSP